MCVCGLWNIKNLNVDICIPITNIKYIVDFVEPSMINIDIRKFRIGISSLFMRMHS